MTTTKPIKRVKLPRKQKGPGRPKNPIKCPICDRIGGTPHQIANTTHKKGETYVSYPWIMQHHVMENGKPKRRNCYLGVNYKYEK